MTEDGASESVQIVLPTGACWSPAHGDHVYDLGEHLVTDLELLPDLASYSRVLAEATRVLALCVPPSTTQDQTRTGLVIGRVQSGKTLSMTALAALARDNGFRLVIVLAGTTKNLFRQSRERLERDLSASKSGARRWRMFANPKHDSDGAAIQATVNEWHDSAIPADRHESILITVMKHHTHLGNLADLLHRLNLKGVPALVIDDEADQASLNTKAAQPTATDPSTTYQRISALRQELPQHTYLQYTATPQALLLISLIDMLSPDFAQVLEPGDGYTGGESFFASSQAPPLFANIPQSQIFPDNSPLPLDPPETLEHALRLFFLGAAIGIQEGARGQRSMFVHPSRATSQQTAYCGWVRRIKDRWYRTLILAEGDPDRDALLEEFEKGRDELALTEPRTPQFSTLLTDLIMALSRTIVTEVNSATGNNVNWRNSYSHILVGGQKLDRGYTVRGLTVTYMPRSPGTWTADTIQQRARFYGYRRGYLKLCRVFLNPDITYFYQTYARHESDVRESLRAHSGRSLDDWARSFYLDRNFRPTRNNILEIPIQRPSFRNDWFEPMFPHVNAQAGQLERVVQPFLDSLAFGSKVHGNHAIATDIPLRRLFDELLVPFRYSTGHDATRWNAIKLMIGWHLERNPDAVCDVYHMSEGTGRNRTADAVTGAIRLFQGRSSATGKGAYPGDRALRDAAKVTLQFHLLKEVRGTPSFKNVPALAVWIPRVVGSADVVLQDQ